MFVSKTDVACDFSVFFVIRKSIDTTERDIDLDEASEVPSQSAETSDPGLPGNMIYTEEFMNSVKVSGFPNHELRLKRGAPIMMHRNIDPTGGLCNGTRLLVTNPSDHVIGAKVITCYRLLENYLSG